MLNRRDLIRAAGAVALGGATATRVARAGAPQAPAAAPSASLCFFSKHLAELGWADLGRTVRDLGFDGVDLTVRAGGHVLPERAADDLPRALDAIRAQGVSVPMVTTELVSAAHPTARPLLRTAASHGVRYFKTGYWRYTASPDVRAQVASAGEALSGLTALAREYGIELGFHNHNAYIGAALWEIAPAMDRLDPKWAGYYFDPRHAVAEGGGGSWKAAMHLVMPRLKMVALKDFFWHKSEKGWHIQDCPLGEGMVDWAWVGRTLAAGGFAGPVSLHFEYEIPGATAAERTRNTMTAAAKDLAFARRMLVAGARADRTAPLPAAPASSAPAVHEDRR
jgi:sugar phosphate isomerase/epimerase